MVRCADTCEHGVPPFYVLFDTSCVLWSIGVTPAVGFSPYLNSALRAFAPPALCPRPQTARSADLCTRVCPPGSPPLLALRHLFLGDCV